MRILVLNADYPRFLDWLYRREQGLESASYARQMAARNASLFGVADFYSRNFAAAGHAAVEIHVNNPWLQSAWAREHGMATAPVEPRGASVAALPGWLQRGLRLLLAGWDDLKRFFFHYDPPKRSTAVPASGPRTAAGVDKP